MSPADELRAAANKLRKWGARATPGPWSASAVWSPRSNNTSAVYSRAHPTGTPESEVIPSMRATPKRPLVRPGDAEWIALMSPAVAEPDAALFEVVAEFAEQYDIGGHVDGEPCSDFACRIVHAALTSARTILGRTS